VEQALWGPVSKLSRRPREEGQRLHRSFGEVGRDLVAQREHFELTHDTDLD
jgi:hypothetical protein